MLKLSLFYCLTSRRKISVATSNVFVFLLMSILVLNCFAGFLLLFARHNNFLLRLKNAKFYGINLIGLNCLILFITSNVLSLDTVLINTITVFNWINVSGSVLINWEFYFDALSVVMLLVVNFISFCVHMYALEYMRHDPNIFKFISYLSLFTFFMLILILGNNLLMLFLGWEGVGLCSYLLISFWYTRVQANKAAIKALVVNRVADFFLTVGLAGIFFIFKTLDFNLLFLLVTFFITKKIIISNVGILALNFICCSLFIGAMGKSAQFGLHTWLPDAMEGPTPVSALIHAATMVTAGVFLIIKCSFIFEYTPYIMNIIVCVGSFTSLFAATIGMMQQDIKKVIAYSTCSQLGYMFTACGLSQYPIAIFHLANHAVFKALLFLTAGAIIHNLSNEQDVRKYGGLNSLMPFSLQTILVGSCALMGLPFLTGFYSKDLIIEISNVIYIIPAKIAFLFLNLAAALTAFYSIRLVYWLVLVKNTNAFKFVIKKAHETQLIIIYVFFFLIIGSIFLGYSAKELFVGFGTDFWVKAVYILPANNFLFENEIINYFIKQSANYAVSLSICLIFFLYYCRIFNSKPYRNVYKFLILKWYMDLIYNFFINIKLFVLIRTFIFETGDKGLFEILGPSLLFQITRKINILLNKNFSGNVSYYLVIMFSGFLLY